MIKKWTVTVPVLSGKKLRRVYLYLPESYVFDTEKRYPVLYMFDGQNIFYDEDASYGKSWGMEQFMDSTGTQLIVVGIESHNGRHWERLSEYSPYDFTEKGIGDVKGQGRQTMNWIVRYLKPFMDRHYRTIPDREHTFIAGSSMGGLMSIYALLYYNRTFSRAASLSPSLWIDPKAAEEMIRKARPVEDTILYMDYGTQEMETHLDMDEKLNMYQMLREYGRMSMILLGKGVMLDSRIVPGGTHTEECWEYQIPFFMNTLMYGIDE